MGVGHDHGGDVERHTAGVYPNAVGPGLATDRTWAIIALAL
jgi:hypothetical protein